MLTACGTKLENCEPDEVLVDVELPECFGEDDIEDCLPVIRSVIEYSSIVKFSVSFVTYPNYNSAALVSRTNKFLTDFHTNQYWDISAFCTLPRKMLDLQQNLFYTVCFTAAVRTMRVV